MLYSPVTGYLKTMLEVIQMKNYYSIGRFSKLSGLSIKALRYYQEIELLVPEMRGKNFYRFYSNDQLLLSQKIIEYKSLGFALEDIKNLIRCPQQSTIKSLLEQRLQAIEISQVKMCVQKKEITSILTSLTKGLELSKIQRSFIMENLFEHGIQGLKRKGILPSQVVDEKLKNEIKYLTSQQLSLVKSIHRITSKAKDLNILLGPLRGMSPSSLILYSEGLSQLNPLKFNLIPEMFSGAGSLWFDVEFTRSKEIGQFCKILSEEINYQIIAFKCPFLDILNLVQKQVGVIDFECFSDDHKAITSAFKQNTLRGIWSYDWSPNFTAFKNLNSKDQQKLYRNQEEFESWIKDYDLNTSEDILNIGFLYEMFGIEKLNLYKSLKKHKVYFDFLKVSSQEILHTTHGLLLWREDWLRILCDNSNFNFREGLQIFNAIKKSNFDSEEYTQFMKLKDDHLKKLLLESVKTVFLKSHLASQFWFIKRSAILKSLWPEIYINTLEDWETKNEIIWQEFGYVEKGVRYFEA